MLLQNKPQRQSRSRDDWDKEDRGRKERAGRDRVERGGRESSPRRERKPGDAPPDEGMQRYRIEVGHDHQVKPGNIVGAIANEADIESKFIGRICIYDDHSTVDLPEGMPKELLYTLKKVWVSGQQLKISLDEKEKNARASDNRKFDKPKSADHTENKTKERKSDERPSGKLTLKSRKKISRRK